MESEKKDREIDELKRNVKMCKHKESEIDVQTYVEECMRLRSILEQTMIQNDELAQQQNNIVTNEEGMHEDNARMQEAYYAQENQLNMERADKNNLQVAMLNEKEEKNQLKEKLKQF